jgi:hypothetical protein
MPDELRIVDRDQDPFAWALQQAELIARGRTGLRALDTEGLREFLEETAADMLAKVTGPMVNLMAHATKAAHSRNPDVVGHWRSECVEFHDPLVDAYRNSMRQRVDLDELWRRAKRKVRASFADHDEPAPKLPAQCPFQLDELVDPELGVDRLVARLRGG